MHQHCYFLLSLRYLLHYLLSFLVCLLHRLWLLVEVSVIHQTCDIHYFWFLQNCYVSVSISVLLCKTAVILENYPTHWLYLRFTVVCWHPVILEIWFICNCWCQQCYFLLSLRYLLHFLLCLPLCFHHQLWLLIEVSVSNLWYSLMCVSTFVYVSVIISVLIFSTGVILDNYPTYLLYVLWSLVLCFYLPGFCSVLNMWCFLLSFEILLCFLLHSYWIIMSCFQALLRWFFSVRLFHFM